MKNTFLFILLSIALSCKAQQIYSLRPTEIDLPENSYEKDTNNELQDYAGAWKGTWDNKTILVTFKKITNKYDNSLKRYRDYLIGKFIVKDSNGDILFDNTNLADDDAKIHGVSFRKYGDKYSLYYNDSELCNTTGSISIEFTNPTKTTLDWKYFYRNEIITADCPYYNTSIPQPLPKEIILIKQ